MKRPLPALRTWLATAALLCAAGCEHNPDVVAELAATTGTPQVPGANAGATGSAGPSAEPGGGNGGTFEVAGTNAHGDGGVPSDGGVAGPEAGPPQCPTDPSYWAVKTIVDDGCKFNPALLPAVARFIDENPPRMGESRPIDICDIYNVPLIIDGDGKWVLCDAACNAAHRWLADQECELKRCMGLIDCDTGDAEDAGI